MLREYELTIIGSTQLPEEERLALFSRYESIVTADGGEVIRKSDWGTRKLAFSMDKQFRGHYVHYDLTAKPENLAEAERLMRIDDYILRYMSVRVGENVDVEARKAEIAKQEALAAASKDVRERSERSERGSGGDRRKAAKA